MQRMAVKPLIKRMLVKVDEFIRTVLKKRCWVEGFPFSVQLKSRLFLILMYVLLGVV